MRARDVVGKRIVAIEQQRTSDQCGRAFAHLDTLVLEDGTRITFSVVELPGDYAIEATARRPARTA